MAVNRIHYIDVLKGLGIIMVVFAHMNTMPLFGGYFYSFHMPLFFFISGILVNPERYSSYKSFAISRIEQLYIPYIVFSLLLYIYWAVVERPLRFLKMPQLDAFLGIFWGTNSSYWIYPGGVTWFLIALFSLEIIVFPVLKWCKSCYLRYGILGLLTVSGLFCSWNHLFILPFSLPNAFLVLPFFVVGYLMRRHLLLSNSFYMGSKLHVLYMLIPVVGFTCWQYPLICNLGKQTDVSYLMCPHFYWFYSIPFVQIGVWLLISILIEKNKFLEYLGKNTLPILAFHLPISRVLIYMSYMIWGCDQYDIREDVIKSICLTITVMLCCWPFIILWNKTRPIIVAFVFRDYRINNS